MEPIEGKIRILIVDDVPEGREGLARLLSFEPDMDVIGFATTGAEAVVKAQDLNPDVILMDINMPDMDGITATEKITQVVATSVVMISVQSDSDYMRRAMQVGAMDFLPKPPSADELYATVRNAYIRRPQPVLSSRKGARDDARQKVKGRIVVVYSPQGGAGVTTMAVNIASGLLDEQHRAVLIDANLQFGDVMVHLSVRNDRNINDLAKAAEDLDPDLIENVLSTHGTGLRVLAGAPEPPDSNIVNARSVSKVVEAMAERFSYVIVDTAPHLDGLTINLFSMADILVLVGIPTLPCVRNLRVILDLLTEIDDFDRSKIVFAMNQIPPDRKSGALDPEAISKTLKLPISAAVPYNDKQMLGSLNRGVPVIVNARQSPGREILDLTEAVKKKLQSVVEDDEELEIETPSSAQKRSGLFRR